MYGLRLDSSLDLNQKIDLDLYLKLTLAYIYA